MHNSRQARPEKFLNDLRMLGPGLMLESAAVLGELFRRCNAVLTGGLVGVDAMGEKVSARPTHGVRTCRRAARQFFGGGGTAALVVVFDRMSDDGVPCRQPARKAQSATAMVEWHSHPTQSCPALKEPTCFRNGLLRGPRKSFPSCCASTSRNRAEYRPHLIAGGIFRPD